MGGYDPGDIQTGAPRPDGVPRSELPTHVDPAVTPQPEGHDPDTRRGLPPPGARIGRYTVLRKLGEGAMGVVVSAYDEELNRRVAIKLVSSGGVRRARDRMVREAQALARLSHPNVVQIYEVGDHGAHMYLAMEYVEGDTMRVWLREQARRPWREVLHPLIQVGRGLAAAHSAGIIHRDLKPENVLVGSDGRLRVLDFGLARAEGSPAGGRLPGAPDGEHPDDEVTTRDEAVENTGVDALHENLTEFGAVVGTPAYMAPEQFLGGELDARTDQFAFSVMLYEALYGVRPHRGCSFGELKRVVLSGSPARPPSGSGVPPWLQRAVMRGLSLERDQRWPSLDALLTVLEKTPQVRTRRRALAAVIGITGALAATTAVAFTSRPVPCRGAAERLAEVWDGERRGAVEQALLATEVPYAAAVAEATLPRLDAFAGSWTDMYTDACEATHVRGEQSERLLDLRMTCLDGRLVEFAAFVDVLREADAEVAQRASMAAANLPPVHVCADLEALQRATPPPRDGEEARRAELIRERVARARALEQAGKYEDGVALSTAALADAESLAHGPTLAAALRIHGLVLIELGRFDDATPVLRQAYREALVHRDDALAAVALTDLVGLVGLRKASFDAGLVWGDVAGAVIDRADAKAARIVLLTNIGIIHLRRDEYDEAEELLGQALTQAEREHGASDPRLLEILDGLGALENFRRNPDAARAQFLRALEIAERELGKEHPRTGKLLNNLGSVARRQGSYEEALGLYQRAVAIAEKTLDPGHPVLAGRLTNLGLIHRDLGELEQAQALLERAVAIGEKTLDENHPNLATMLDNLGGVLARRGQHAAAVTHLQRALTITEKALGADHVYVAETSGALAQALADQEKWDEARPHFERTISILERKYGPESADVARPLTDLGRMFSTAGRPADAVPVLTRAVAIREALGDAVDPGLLANSRISLASALAKLGERERARAYAVQARDGFRAAGERWSTNLADAETWLAEHDAAGR